MFDLTKTLKVLPVHIIDAHMKKEVALRMGEELESLIHTLGATIVDRVMQKLDRPETATFIGKGKIQEIAQLIEQKKIDLVILSRMAKPRQIHQLKKTFLEANPKIEVWDRVDLILHIFDKHAKTVEARLQIEMARMEYMGPRIYGMGFELSQQGGGIGVRGIGETNTERMKRHWRSEIKRVEDQLTKLTQNRQSQIAFRKRNGLKTVSIVGYTNAGKSSLFNKLTHKESYVADVLFATLETTVGKLYISKLHKEVLATDTIGFIRNLPPKLIKAFKSTLLESIHADILLHVVDISDAEWEVKMLTVNEILSELGRKVEDIIYICNKIDLVESRLQQKIKDTLSGHTVLFVSAKTSEGIESIKETIGQRLSHEVS